MEIDSLFSSEPYAAEPYAAEPYAAGPAPVDHRPQQAAYVLTIMLLVLVAAGLAVGWLLTTRSAEAWQATAERRTLDLTATETERDDVRRQLLESQQALASVREDLAATTVRLDETTAEVKALTDAQAAMLDKATFMPAALAMSTELAQSVSACVVELQGGAPESPPDVTPLDVTPADVTPPAAEPVVLVAPAVEGLSACDRARTDSEALTKWLGSQ